MKMLWKKYGEEKLREKNVKKKINVNKLFFYITSNLFYLFNF